MTKVLVVDDEQSIVTLLQFNLTKAGFEVETAMDGLMALQMVNQSTPDFIILDLMLPELDGMEVCKQLRQGNNDVPILMLTAKDDEIDKILGLELGADDYLTKPFSPREVIARIKAILRRSQGRETDQQAKKVIEIGDLSIDIDKHEVRIDGQMIDLTPKEFELLIYLAQHRGKVMSREQLLNQVWNFDYMGDTRIVDVHVSHLREKIEANSRQPEYIKTIRGLGYKFEGPGKT
ncbi:response regulator transcription factor [Microaerobacter geothermalis]|uniref:response regulator transcription factor n=1 Tax=Microaerobacter geothermalis TaxID=674972 RepID=UPI001F3EBE4C|nr:response regulator transcription factor [Microaerobacter geothermalis]MCF6092961.1 response regulator transcription factor [Microaerobacter geothermalis]